MTPARARHPGEAFARRAVTGCGAIVVAACFWFSFGNIGRLGLRLGVHPWIAWLVAPALDLTVVGLVVGIRHLSRRGFQGRELLPARVMLLLAGLATLGLNTATAVARRHWGLALYDAIPPLLLLGWAEVGPWFLRCVRDPARQVPAAPAGGQASPTRPPATAPPRPVRRPGAATAASDRTGVQARLAAAYATGRPDGQPWTARTLAAAAGCGRTAAAAFLRDRQPAASAATPLRPIPAALAGLADASRAATPTGPAAPAGTAGTDTADPVADTPPPAARADTPAPVLAAGNGHPLRTVTPPSAPPAGEGAR